MAKTKPEPKKQITKATKRICRYLFNDVEKLVIGKELAERSNALSAIESDKKRIVADFAAKIAAEESMIQVLSTKITSGYEHRELPCTITMHCPEPGKKRVARDDTGEVVATEDMSQDELQPELEFPNPVPE